MADFIGRGGGLHERTLFQFNWRSKPQWTPSGITKPHQGRYNAKTMHARLFALLILGAVYASAGSIAWTLQNAVFDDGGTLTGSFTALYFSDPNQPSSLSNITVASSGAGSFSGMSYAAPFSANVFMFTPAGGSTVWGIELWAQDGGAVNHRLLINFESPFTEAGGTVAILPGFVAQDSNHYSFEELSLANDPIRYLTGGSITAASATEAPEPSTPALLLATLCGTLLTGVKCKWPIAPQDRV